MKGNDRAGDRPFKAVTRVQIPLGTPDSEPEAQRDSHVTRLGPRPAPAEDEASGG
jgi:hypothetical protein